MVVVTQASTRAAGAKTSWPRGLDTRFYRNETKVIRKPQEQFLTLIYVSFTRLLLNFLFPAFFLGACPGVADSFFSKILYSFGARPAFGQKGVQAG
jgi:hypothetical protein